MSQKTSFHVPFLASETRDYIEKVLKEKELGGNNVFTKSIHQYFSEHYGFRKSLFVHSGSLALQMAAILADLKDGDEVLVPSYGYVTTASSFLINGAQIVFCDSEPTRPHIDPDSIKERITKKTKALVVLHYGGVSCNMNEIIKIVEKYNLLLIEDCAHAIGSRDQSRALGSYGDMSVFSFQQAKNIQCGEGGLIVINNSKLHDQADLIWSEGTNKKEFDEGIIPHYEWVAKGSSYQPSEIIAATLRAQLSHIQTVSERIRFMWDRYYYGLKYKIPYFECIAVPNKGNSVHGFYLLCESAEQLSSLEQFLDQSGISAHKHYPCLHKSKYWKKTGSPISLPNAEFFAKHLLRLPLYFDLKIETQDVIIDLTVDFFKDE